MVHPFKVLYIVIKRTLCRKKYLKKILLNLKKNKSVQKLIFFFD